MNGLFKREKEQIHTEMLKELSDEYIKSVGTFSFDMTRSFAIQAAELWCGFEEISKKLDVNNLFDIELEKFVFQRRGVERKAASHSKGELFLRGNRVMQIGDTFETELGTKFMVIESKIINGEGAVKIQAMEPGHKGNVGANTIKYMPITLNGISEARNLEATYNGYDTETDDSLKERYLLEVQKPATSGNIYHYMLWSREIVGVGDSRVFPLWNGNNTVKVVIINDYKQPADRELIEKVQEYIDPKQIEGENTWGTGAGVAPIGCYCEVTSATALAINIECGLILEKSYTVEEVKPVIELTFSEYFKDLAFKKNRVSYAVLSSLLLDIKGIADWTKFELNGLSTSINIAEEEVAILGEVIVNAHE